VAMEVGTR